MLRLVFKLCAHCNHIAGLSVFACGIYAAFINGAFGTFICCCCNRPYNRFIRINRSCGDFNGTTLDGISILGITGEIPEKLSERSTKFSISGEIIASTANTITLLTYDGVNITCNTENAANESTGGLLTGSSVKITFNPADSRKTNIYKALKIEDL